MKKFILILTVISFQWPAWSQSNDFFQRTDQFLKKYVSKGRVDYQAVKNDKGTLNELVDLVAGHSLESKSDVYIKAFLTNSYNLLIIKQIVDNYPVQGPMAINGFFDKQKYKVAGYDLTLNQLEKGWLYQEFPDPRLHFALVCAAVGCPPVAGFAFQPVKLDQQLDDVTRKALNNDDFIRVDEAKQKVWLSQIFNWYKKDFLTEADGVLEYVNKYRAVPFDDNYKTGYYDYDWSLNDVDKRDS